MITLLCVSYVAKRAAEMPKQFSKRDEARLLVKYQFDHGVRSASIISSRTSVPLSTVYDYLAKLKATGRIEDANRPGRPRKNTSRLRRQVAQIKRQTPRAPARVLAAKVSAKSKAKVSIKTVQRALHQMEYHWRLPGRKKLTEAQRVPRLAFARAHVDDDWGDTWSFDEAYFNLYRHSNRCWISASTEQSVQQPKLTSAQEKISVGICFAICRSRKSALGFLPKNWSGPDLINVFKQTIMPSIQWPKQPSRRHHFIIDNDGRHQMQVWKDYVAQIKLQPFSPWPSNSPDLNPIENLFAWMKRNVEDRSPSTEQELREAIQEAFQNIPTGHLQHLMDSMKTRMTETIQSQGKRISY